ncbi:hypothetical protein Trydic_g3481 [Trypoxylus dichotomus]
MKLVPARSLEEVLCFTPLESTRTPMSMAKFRARETVTNLLKLQGRSIKRLRQQIPATAPVYVLELVKKSYLSCTYRENVRILKYISKNH